MSKMIQIRHVPDELHRQLRARAAGAGMTLSDYLRMEMERSVARLSLNELRARLALLEPTKLPESSVAAVRRERDSR